MRQAVRLPEPTIRPEVEARGKARADILRPYVGRFVARKAGQVIFDAETPHEVVHWLDGQGVEGAAIFRVPVDPSADTGMHGQD